MHERMDAAWRSTRVLLAVGLSVAQPVGAQQMPTSGPVASPTTLASADHLMWLRASESTVAPLRKAVSLDLRQTSLRKALNAIAAASDLQIGYDAEVVRATTRVSLHVDGMTVGEALGEVLTGTPFTAYVSVTGKQILVRTPFPIPPRSEKGQQGGMVKGQVVDAVLRTPLAQAAVFVEGPGLKTTTGADGKYTLADIASGTYRVTARRVGYTPLTKNVAVAADQPATLDFALATAPTRLDEIVTTAVGQQRRYEVGSSISTINADSIAPTAPITSLTDLISARAPGVEVLESSGMAGSGEAIRIRGLSSLVLQNDPILIVDGVRQDKSGGGDIAADFSSTFGGDNGTHPTPTRLNDIDFNDIASIDILKGPSASTEYGTDAANGVIVIETKHGTAGPPRWRISGEQTASDLPVHFPNGYYSWGHTTDGQNTPVDCRLVPRFGGPASTTHTCAVDSITQWNPLNHAATSIFTTGNRGKYDLSVSGGSPALRYFVSGGLSNETGAIQMPPVFRELADTAHLGLPRSAFNPNGDQQRSVRANMVAAVARTTDLTANVSYLSTYQETPDAAELYLGAITSPALNDAAHEYGYDYFSIPSPVGTPLGLLSSLGSENTDRATGGLTANWRPIAWFVGRSTIGIDHGSQRREVLNYPLANSAYVFNNPILGIANGTTDIYSVDLRGTATASLASSVRAVTSLGMQMVDSRTVGQSGLATGITATNLTLNGATAPITTQASNRQATLGGYGEEQLSFQDRLFATGAIRIDAGSGFGRAYSTAVYPKASVSWLAVDAARTTLRVRGAFGESGVQPTNGAAMTLFAPSVAYANGASATGYLLSWPGNPRLQPERSTEFEAGADVGGWGNRVSLELTAYSKTTRDALVNVNLGQSLGDYVYQENIGKVTNTGLEGTASIAVVQGRLVAWDVALNASVNRNKLLALAPGVPLQQEANGYGQTQAVGYPLYGIWWPHLTYGDANHDSIIEANEVTLADTATYVGPSLPAQEASVSTHVDLWHGAVALGGLVDYRGGYRIMNVVAVEAAYAGNLRAVNDRTAPLWMQARAVEDQSFAFNSLDAEDGSFVRVREVSVTCAVPRSLVHALRVESAHVTAAVRNLALWTRYSGVDPEVSNSLGGNIEAAPTAGGFTVNNDTRTDFGAVPLLRYWVVRLNIGL